MHIDYKRRKFISFCFLFVKEKMLSLHSGSAKNYYDKLKTRYISFPFMSRFRTEIRNSHGWSNLNKQKKNRKFLFFLISMNKKTFQTKISLNKWV